MPTDTGEHIILKADMPYSVRPGQIFSGQYEPVCLHDGSSWKSLFIRFFAAYKDFGERSFCAEAG